MKKGQIAFEFLITAIIETMLLLLGVTSYIQQELASQEVAKAVESLVECNKIADTISAIYTSKSGETAEQSILLTKKAQILRTGNAGQITVGSQYCYYFGNAAVDNDLKKAPNPQCYDNTSGFAIGSETIGSCNYANKKFKLAKIVYSGTDFVVFVPQT